MRRWRPPRSPGDRLPIVQPRARSRSSPSSRSAGRAGRARALAVPELGRADDRRDSELALAHERLRVDRRARARAARRARFRRGDPGAAAPARPASARARRRRARRRRRRSNGLLLSQSPRCPRPPGGLVGERPEGPAAGFQSRGRSPISTSSASPARSAERARLAALEQQRVPPSSRASSRTAPSPSQSSSASASCSDSRCGRASGRRRPVRELGLHAWPAAPGDVAGVSAPCMAQFRPAGGGRVPPGGVGRGPAVRLRAAGWQSDGSRSPYLTQPRAVELGRRSPSPRRAPARARFPTDRRSASARKLGRPGSVSPTCAGGGDEDLVLDRPRPQQHLPVVLAGVAREVRRNGREQPRPRARGSRYSSGKRRS